MRRLNLKTLFASAAVAAVIAAAPARAADAPVSDILNVSYDISRELYAKLNTLYKEERAAKGLPALEVKQSHGGSSKQARSILEGLPADVVTFNQVPDVQVLADKGFVAADWAKKFPNDASPYYSLPAFLVRKGNPKNIKSWDDLVRADVQVVFPNPKTSGNARYTYLAAYAYALESSGGNADKAKDFVGKLLANVPVFDTGGRAATTTFVERGTGDVLVTFEAEVRGIQQEFGADRFDAVVPPVSLLADFPVAVVDKVADRRGSRAESTAYLTFLYSKSAQDVLAQTYNRVRDPDVVAKYKAQFPEVRLLTIDSLGGWAAVNKAHFAEGALLDQVFVAK